MPINDLKEKIYSPKSEIQNRTKDVSNLDPRQKNYQNLKATDSLGAKKGWQKGGEVLQTQKKILFKVVIAVIILLVIAGIAYAAYVYWKGRFKKENVILRFNLPENIETGQEFKFNFIYHNNNRASLKSCALKVVYPENFELTESEQQPTDATDDFIIFNSEEIKANENGTLNFKGRVTDKENELSYLNAILECVNDSGAKEIISTTQEGLNVASARISLQLEATRQASSGDVVEYLLKITNTTKENLNGIEARLEYPSEFNFVSSTIAPSNAENNVFKFATIQPKETVEIKIAGNLSGSSAEKKRLIAKVGTSEGQAFNVLAQEEAQTEMVSSPLTITQTLVPDAESVDPGEKLNFTISYQNNSDLPLRDVIITAQLEGRVLEYSEIIVDNEGNFDLNTKQITWRAAELPELAVLAPHASGEVKFKIPVSEHLPSEKAEDKNFTVASFAQIDSPDVPTPFASNKVISSAKRTVKVSSKVVFDTTVLFNDNLIPNTGSLPPKVGEKTTYTVHFKIANINNDLKDATVRATLPDYVSWEKVTSPSQTTEISYNERTHEIIWKPNNVPAFSGTTSPLKEIAFQIGLEPRKDHVGKELILINNISFTATDTFTNKNYQLTDDQISTVLKDDISVGYEQSIIVE